MTDTAIRFRCSHPTTSENVVYRRKHPGQPFKPACKACEQRGARKRQLTRSAKGPTAKVKGRKPWIVPTGPRYKQVMAEALAQFKRETGDGQTYHDQRQHNLWVPR